MHINIFKRLQTSNLKDLKLKMILILLDWIKLSMKDSEIHNKWRQ